MKTIKWLYVLLALLALPMPAWAEEAAPRVLYRGAAKQNLTIRAEQDRAAEGVGYLREGDRVDVIAYEPGWLRVVQAADDGWAEGWVLRHTVRDVAAVVEDILPYGADPAAYTASLARDERLLVAPEEGADALLAMEAGTRLAILDITDGWARVVYQRQYGYFHMDAAEGLTPVYDTASAQAGDTIAAYVSFYNISESGLNPNRIVNIHQACEYIALTLAPGEAFSFNAIAGPFRRMRGYLEAPAFVGGETVASYGGGTCQVSSTLYNVLLPLTVEHLTIVYRVAHGAGGVAYMPHGVDAACGNERIDLKFRNDYDFAFRIEAGAQHGVLYIALVRA